MFCLRVRMTSMWYKVAGQVSCTGDIGGAFVALCKSVNCLVTSFS